jgi:general secretion pathway protein K
MAALAPRRNPRWRVCGRAQRGAALLLALFVVTLAVVIVSGLFWRQFVLARTAGNQQRIEQAHLILDAAQRWAHMMLESSPHPAYDTLADPWATPLAPTPLDQFSIGIPVLNDATLEGSLQDAQARFNLRNLVDVGAHINPEWLTALEKLCTLLSVPPAAAPLIANHIAQAYSNVPTPNNATPANPNAAGFVMAPGAAFPLNTGTRVLPPVFPEDLLGIPGLDPAAAQALAPFVVLLDQSAIPVNFNTASAPVMAAVVPKLSLADATNLAAERDRAYFINPADVQKRLRDRGSLNLSNVATSTSYFLLQGTVSIGETRHTLRSLLRRGAGGPNGRITVLWQRDD